MSTTISGLIRCRDTIGVVLNEDGSSTAVWNVTISAEVGARLPGQGSTYAALNKPVPTTPPATGGTPGSRAIALARAPNGEYYKVLLTLVSGTPSPAQPTISFFQGVQILTNAVVVFLDGVAPPRV